MRSFQLPNYYSSEIIESARKIRDKYDPKKKDISPTIIKLKGLEFYIGRHFGFCYGVKNAIEICYKALKVYPKSKIYLLSEMIHNQLVNNDLLQNGISFIMDTMGNQLISWDKIKKEDIIIIPAFGTSLEILEILKKKQISIHKFDTTCPFVSKVWNRSELLAKQGYTIIIHGKAKHEETRSTFSRCRKHGPSIIVENIDDVNELCKIIRNKNQNKFLSIFQNKCSNSFNIDRDLIKIGVVNQTTMLASETKKIINKFKDTYSLLYGDSTKHVANTRDTLCYATNENQDSTLELLKHKADLSIIVGGYNSSNTSHLVELSSKKIPTYFINSEKNIKNNTIRHFDLKLKKMVLKENFLPQESCKIILTSGASCPDVILEKIMNKIVKIRRQKLSKEEVLNTLEKYYKK
ncbi:MAG: 4-hydroxy-3-methylbut-2-enyl diphosphate reductase [Flavobacteriales bacterium]|nr:4-hydroxy-3-methylbut-2-enyl diphosphate reductase [Flavobacteriales bacterium]|tara:strand:- start:12376 stop:13596 length:1221 start_codon:yes stop_codon:yes gene_type:complete